MTTRPTELRGADLPDSPIAFTGVAWLEPTAAGGLQVHRLPEWTRHQIVDPTIGLVQSMTTGVCMRFTSDATSIELDVQATMVRFEDEPVVPAVIDVVVDGELVAGTRTDIGTQIVLRRGLADIEVVPGPPATLRVDGLGVGDKAIELWLPNAAVVELLALRLDGGLSAPPTTGRRRWVHHGSSISHCIEADRPTGAWPVVAARLADVDLRSLGLAGQAQLDQFAARTIRDAPADLISLKLGINVVNADSMRERTFVPAVHGFLDTVRDGHPRTPIVVITPIICPVAEDHPGPTATSPAGGCQVVDRPEALAIGALTLQRIRSLLAGIVSTRVAHGDEHLHLVDGLALFGPDDVDDLPDGLHPNAAGYRRMGERFHALAFGPTGPFTT